MLKRNASVCGILLAALATALGGCHFRSDDDVAAERTFRESLGKTTVTVFPACLRDGKNGRHHDAAAGELAGFLNNEKLATAEVSAAHVPLSAFASFSQPVIYDSSIKEFRAWLRDHPVTTDYAVLPEYLLDGRDRPIGVHAYVLHRDGAEAFGIALNSHHASFKSVQPQKIDDATRVLIEGLRTHLVKPEEKK